MTAAVPRLLATAAWLAATVTLALPAVRSDATFNSRSANQASAVLADDASNYLRLYSQATDPAGLTGYATKENSSPLVPAATGSSGTLAVALGAWKNEKGTDLTRVFTLQARSPLPAGASPLTVTASLEADPTRRAASRSAPSPSPTPAARTPRRPPRSRRASRSSSISTSRPGASPATPSCCSRRSR